VPADLGEGVDRAPLWRIGRVFRQEYGRSVAALTGVLGDIDLVEDAVQDDRLRLIFTCCHPALSPQAQVALTLRLLGDLMPDEPEVAGLLALLLLTESRRGAQYTADGSFVVLSDQDRQGWDRAMIDEGQAIVRHCLRRGGPGLYHL